MTEQAVSPLRRRMIEDMTLRKLSRKSQDEYIRRVKWLNEFLGRSPDKATPEDVRLFQLHLKSKGLSDTNMRTTCAALRFFFNVTLNRPDLSRPLAPVRMPRKLRIVLSPEEVVAFLEAAPSLKYKAAFSVAYGAGLRVSEVATLKVSDIDSKRMLLRIEQGKGRKDRNAMLSPQLLELLRDWYRVARPQGWLFPGQVPVNPMTPRQLERICRETAATAGIKKRVTPHTLRHSFATHLLEQGIDIRVIQVLLGHANIETTALYVEVATNIIRKVKGPLDRLKPLRPTTHRPAA
jgi:integrase/recombinase XerD